MPLIPALIAMARAHNRERERLMGRGAGGASAGRALKYPQLTLEENNEISQTLSALGEDEEFPDLLDSYQLPTLKLPKSK